MPGRPEAPESLRDTRNERVVHRFIAETVDVVLSGELPEPIRFRWRGDDYLVEEVLQRWSDWNFGAGSHRRSWRNRRHRNYYRVKTAQGVYELYFDRGVPEGTGRWILVGELGELPEDPHP